MDKNNEDNIALNITWNKSVFDLPVVSSQQLQFAVKGKNFVGATAMDAVTSPITLTNKQLNSMALSFGGSPHKVFTFNRKLQLLT